ncbi:MAG: DUF72 domain-containing protein [Verrucomicrobiota bacterium]
MVSGEFDRDRFREELARLAAGGVYLGTSSWKYPGWEGRLYTRDRYVWHGRFSQARFERTCLAEYAEVFKTVGVDAAYYAFPTAKYLAGLREQVPADFLFSFKVTDDITLKHFPNLPRFGRRAGQPNPDFLNADRFATSFLGPLETIRNQVGLLIFEFSHFHPPDYHRGRDFVQDLDDFLRRLPGGWRYGVELRNRSFLHPRYFDVLARHRVTHVFNSWEAMPPVAEQRLTPGCRTVPELIGARFLLRPGRRYEEAVRQFSPYDQVREVYPEGREAGADLIAEAWEGRGGIQAFIYINNRFEGNALATLAAMVDGALAILKSKQAGP